MKKKDNTAFRQSYALTSESIDLCSEYIYNRLINMRMERKNALRIRLSLEEILIKWQQTGSADQTFSMECRRRLGQNSIILKFKGAQMNPLEQMEMDGAEEEASQRSILGALGVLSGFRYVNGINCVTLRPQKQGLSTIASILGAIALAALLGGLCQLLPGDIVSFLSGEVLKPLSDAFMRVLMLVSCPMIFLSLLTGIINIGDMASLGKLGSSLVRASFGIVALLSAVPLALSLPLAELQLSSASMGGSAFSELYGMLLNIIPADIFSPFTSGNSMQIIVIAVMLGLAILAVGNKNSSLTALLLELNNSVQYIMSLISKALPAFVFVSILNMILNGSLAGALRSYLLIILNVVSGAIVIVIYLAVMSAKYRISPVKLMRKLLPTFMIGLTTASSAAAFATNSEDCVKKLGISRKAADFGVPVGQVIFMPGCMISFLLSSVFTAAVHQIPISIGWLILALVISVVLAVAAPPIPGGTLTCFTIIFMQLGLPVDYMSVILSISLLTEFVATAVNLFCLQNQMVLIADKNGMLDRDTLLR